MQNSRSARHVVLKYTRLHLHPEIEILFDILLNKLNICVFFSPLLISFAFFHKTVLILCFTRFILIECLRLWIVFSRCCIVSVSVWILFNLALCNRITIEYFDETNTTLIPHEKHTHTIEVAVPFMCAFLPFRALCHFFFFFSSLHSYRPQSFAKIRLLRLFFDYVTFLLKLMLERISFPHSIHISLCDRHDKARESELSRNQFKP